MPFRLIQGKVIDAAESVDKLNFAALHGSEPWEICIVWDDCAECIVRVIWKDAEAYQVRIHCGGRVYPAQNIAHQGAIVPSVKHWVNRLFRGACLNLPILHNRQATIIVQPIMEG